MAAGSARLELGNRFFEPGDEWVDPETGAHVDAMFRDPAFVEEELDRALRRHQARVGYSTAFWHGVLHSLPLHDPRCPLRPPGLLEDVEGFLRATALDGDEAVRRADALGEGLDRLLRTEGLLPEASRGPDAIRP